MRNDRTRPRIGKLRHCLNRDPAGNDLRGGTMRRSGVLLAALALLVAAPAAHAQSGGPNPPWPNLLPPAPSPADVQPGPVPGCRKASMKCMDGVIRKLKARRDRL